MFILGLFVRYVLCICFQISIKDLKNKLYITQYSIGLSHNRCGPQGLKSGGVGPPGPNLGQYDQKMGPILGLSYSRVHISSDTAFFKILKKPSIVQK